LPFNCVVLCSSCSLLIGLGLRMSDERRLLSSQASRALRIPKGSLKVSQGIIHVFLALCLGLLLIESKVYGVRAIMYYYYYSRCGCDIFLQATYERGRKVQEYR